MNSNEFDWFISDTHFGHKNIIAYCGRPQNADALMVKLWKERIGSKDRVLHLGDLALPDWRIDVDGWWNDLFADLPGKIFLIPGNHDRKKSLVQMKRLGVEIIPTFTDAQHKVMFTHKPQYLANAALLNIHGHIHNNKYPCYVAGSKGRYCNISVEVTGYAPVQMEGIRQKLVGNCPADVGIFSKGSDPEILGEEV